MLARFIGHAVLLMGAVYPSIAAAVAPVPSPAPGAAVLSGPRMPGELRPGLLSAEADGDGRWLIPIRQGPRGHTAVHDPVRNRMLVFGGSTQTGPNNDLWALDLDRRTWSRLEPAGPLPQPRIDHAAIYDPYRDRMLVLGGQYGGTKLNDVWALELAGGPSWVPLDPAGTLPAGRSMAVAVFDSIADRLLWFGGEGSSTRLADLWQLDLSGSPVWTEIAAIGTAPPALSGAGALFDPRRNRMVVHDGESRMVWSLKLSEALTWVTLSASPGPGSRTRFGVAYDHARDRMLVLGGVGLNRASEECWAFALGTNEWTELQLTGPRLAMSCHTAIHDPRGDRVLVYGGNWDDNHVFELALTGSVAWSAGAGFSLPSDVGHHGAVYDPVGNRMVTAYSWTLDLGPLPAWIKETAGVSHAQAVYDPLRRRALELTGTQVLSVTLDGPMSRTVLATLGTPPAGPTTVILDQARDRLLAFVGGADELWELPLKGTPPTWRQLQCTGSPGARSDRRGVYDLRRDRMILFGGREGSTYVPDVWALPLGDSLVWTRLAAANPPAVVEGASLVYDSRRDRLVVHGGTYTSGRITPITEFIDDTHVLPLADSLRWRPLAPSGWCVGRAFHSAIYDHAHDRMVVFGGPTQCHVSLYCPDLDDLGSNDVWSLEFGDPAPGAEIGIAPRQLDFGVVPAGYSGVQRLLVSNLGAADLEVSGIYAADPGVAVSPASFVLPPGRSREVAVTWSPVGTGPLPATLTLASNDPASPSTEVSLKGQALVAPRLGTDAESLHVALAPAQRDSRILRVSNTGGVEYAFTAQVVDSVVPAGGADARRGAAADSLNGAGGPDPQGYTFVDSDSPGGPGFAWIDLLRAGIGFQILVQEDDGISGPHAIGFPFPFYGDTFTSFSVCSNGWISFTERTSTSYSNVSIPSTDATVPKSLLAPFWDDLTPHGTGRIYFVRNTDYLGILYQEVARVEEPARTNTFQVLLYRDGTILFQYLALGSSVESATVGIQNATGEAGLEVAFDSPYLRNALAIRFRPPSRLMRVAPAAGVVPPGGSIDLHLTLDAPAAAGEYFSLLRLHGSDPQAPRKDIPVRVIVDPNTPIQVASRGWRLVNQRIVVTWFWGAENAELDVERRAEGGPWRVVDRISARRGERLEWTSPDAPDGGPRAYRLRGSIDGVDWTGGEVEIQPSGELRFALQSGRGNPGPEPLRVQVVAEKPRTVEMSVLDVSGRRVWGASTRLSQPGVHAIELAPGMALPAGWYVLHARSEGTSLSRRELIVR